MSRPPHFPPWYPSNVGIAMPASLGAATNNQLLMGTNDGHVYAYNVLTKAVTLVEALPVDMSGQLSWVGAFNGTRMTAWDPSTSQTQVSYWSGDSATTTNGAQVQTAAWDFDLPENTKLLEGFHVVSEIPTSTTTPKTVQISYQLDESGAYTATTLLTAANATTGDNYIPVSSLAGGTKTFRLLRMQIVTTGGMKVYSVTARARVADTQEVWTLFLLTENEMPNGPRPSDKTRTGAQIRKLLRDLSVTKAITEFKDGYRDYQTGTQGELSVGYSTHPVIIDEVEDIVDNDGGGKFKVILKAAGSLTATPSSGQPGA